MIGSGVVSGAVASGVVSAGVDSAGIDSGLVASGVSTGAVSSGVPFHPMGRSIAAQSTKAAIFINNTRFIFFPFAYRQLKFDLF